MARRRPWEPNPETMLEDLIELARRDQQGRREALAAAGRKGSAATAANRKAKSEAASAKRAAIQAAARKAKAKNSPPPGRRIVDQLVACMEPGNWYGVGDVVRAAGLERHTRGKFLQVMLAEKLVERRKNPEWRPNRIWTPNEPRWLYRLTPAGEELWQKVY